MNMIIKVCGMRDSDNIRSLEALDIDWMGFVFYSGSPRIELLGKKTEPEEAVIDLLKVLGKE